VIAYFDTSGLIPLVLSEPGTAVARRAWAESTRLVSSALVVVEASAALARARRMDRISQHQLRELLRSVAELVETIDVVEISEVVLRDASRLAVRLDLRAYDAVHLASAASLGDDELVLVAGDRELAAAAERLGIATMRISE